MTKKSLRQRVLEMEVGDIITIPLGVHPYTTIRSYAYELGINTGRSFNSHLNRDTRTYTITRVS